MHLSSELTRSVTPSLLFHHSSKWFLCSCLPYEQINLRLGKGTKQNFLKHFPKLQNSLDFFHDHIWQISFQPIFIANECSSHVE